MCFPSGENRPRDSPAFDAVSDLPEVTSIGVSWIVIDAGVNQRCDVFVFASSETSTTEYRIHLPSGDSCGSLTRFINIRSSKRIGRMAWPPAAAVPVGGWLAAAGSVVLSGDVCEGFVVSDDGRPNAGGVPVVSGGGWLVCPNLVCPNTNMGKKNKKPAKIF